MTDFELINNVALVQKKDSWLMRAFHCVVFIFCPDFMERFWTTYRIPFFKCKIAYPSNVNNPLSPVYRPILEHELIHVKFLNKWYGPLSALILGSIFPFPVLFSGRWFIERYAYLHDIKSNIINIDYATETLWNNYGFCWPKFLMRRWFERHLKQGEI